MTEAFATTDTILLAALGMPAGERGAYVARACGGDEALRREVVELLAAASSAESDGFLRGVGTPGPRAVAAVAGETIGPYRLLAVLGHGAQATVYRAHDPALGREVALKVLRNLDPTEASNVVRRFQREASAMAALDHPALCAVHDTGVDDGRAWIAMRLIDGRSLAELLAAHRDSPGKPLELPVPDPAPDAPAAHPGGDGTGTGGRRQGPALRLVALFEQVARALHLAHERGLVHRDVKPGNLMVTRAGAPVVLDFGIAHAADTEGGLGLTGTTDVLGTPAYMAPEMLRGNSRAVDRRADVYGLGVTLYECLCGQRPFEGASLDQLYQQILHDEPTSLRTRSPGIPRDLAVVVATAIDKDPDRRYATALQLAEDLRAVRCHQPIRARPITVFGRAARWARRQPVVAASLLFAFAALATGFVLSRMRIAEFEAEREARYGSESAWTARGTYRGGAQLQALFRLGEDILGAKERAIDLDGLLASIELDDGIVPMYPTREQDEGVLQALSGWSETLVGVERIVVADRLHTPLVHHLVEIGDHLRDPLHLADTAIGLAELRLRLLAELPDDDLRVVQTRVMLLDALTATDRAEHAALARRRATGWLDLAPDRNAPVRSTASLLYESRLGLAQLRLGDLAAARHHLAAAVPQLLAPTSPFATTGFDIVALAGAVELCDADGGPELVPDQAAELVRRLARTTPEWSHTPCQVMALAFGRNTPRRDLWRRLCAMCEDYLARLRDGRQPWQPSDYAPFRAALGELDALGIACDDPVRHVVALMFPAAIATTNPQPRLKELLFEDWLPLVGVSIAPDGTPVLDAVRIAQSGFLWIARPLARKAASLVADHRYDLAERWWEAVLTVIPEDHDLYAAPETQYGRVLAVRGDYERAEYLLARGFGHLVQFYGEDYCLRNNHLQRLLQVLQLTGRYREAVALAERRCGIDDDVTSLLAWLADTHWQFGRPHELRAAVQRAQRMFDVQRTRGELDAQQQRDLTRQIDAWQARAALLAGDDRGALEAAQRVTHDLVEGEHHQVAAIEVLLLTRMGRGAEAEQAFARAPLIPEPWHEHWAALGYVVDADGHRWSARDWLARWTAEHPSDVDGWFVRARTLLALAGDTGDAAQAAAMVAEGLHCADQAAISCAHRRPYVLATLAEAQHCAGRVDEAAATAEQCLAMMGGEDAMYLTRAQAEARLRPLVR